MASYASQLLVVRTLPRKKVTQATTPAKQQKSLIVAGTLRTAGSAPAVC